MEYVYEPVSQAWPTMFLQSHADTQVLATRPSNSQGTHFVLSEFSVHNRSGSDATVGIGGRIASSLWRFYTWDDSEYAAGTVLTDDTTDAQDSGTGDVNLDTVSTNNDGLAIGCNMPFNIASLMISQASTANTVWKVYYSIASAGTGFSNNFTEITNLYVAPSFGTTGEQLIWFEPPTDWYAVKSDTAIVNRHGRSDQTVLGYTAPRQYMLVVKSTTAPDTARGQMTIATLGRMFFSTAAVATDGILTNIGGSELHLPAGCDAVAAAISVAAQQSRVDIKYRYAG